MSSIGPVSSFHLLHEQRTMVIADVVESVRLMEKDEEGFIQRWHSFVAAARATVLPAWRGRFHKSTGDGFLLEFADSADALDAAWALQSLCERGNRSLVPDGQMRLRIAAHVADYVADDVDIYGSGVNLLSRLLPLAGPGETVFTSALHQNLTNNGNEVQALDLGRHPVRHLSQPVHAYRQLSPALRRGEAPTGAERFWRGSVQPQRPPDTGFPSGGD